MTLGDVTANIVANTKGFTAGMNEAESKLKQVGEGMQNFGKNMTKYVTLPILAVGGGMAKAAMDLEATEAKYNTVFAGFTESADDFITKYKQLTPATLAEARSMASGIQDMLIPMGFARDMATDLTGEFMHVSGALANFNSGTHTSQQVTEAMNSALTGMYRPLKSLGVDIDATTVKLKAVEMGLADSTDEVSRQAEAQAVLALIYENSTDALDAYNEESLDSKTRMLLLKSEIIDIAAEFGESLLPMINKGIEFFKELAQKLKDLSPEQKEMIVKVMGIVAAVGPLLFILGKILVALPALKAGLLIISGPIGWIIALVIGLTAGFIHLWRTNEEFRDNVIKAWNKIKEVGIVVWEGLKEAALSFWEVLKESWDSIVAIWENHLKPAFQELWDLITEIFKEVQDAINEAFGTSGESAITFKDIMSAVGAALGFIITGIVKVILWIVTAIVTVMSWGLKFSKFMNETGASIRQGVVNWVNGVVERFNLIVDGIARIINWFRELPKVVSNMGIQMLGGLSRLWAGIQSIFTRMVNFLRGLGGAIVNAIVQPFVRAREAVANIASGIKNSLNQINPFAKSSPSLVENVEKGVGEITKQYAKLGESMSFNPVAKSMLQGGDVLNIAINLDGANITSPEIAGEYAEQIGDAIIGKLRGSRRSYA